MKKEPLALFEKCVKAINGEETGTYMLRVGDMCIFTNEWDKKNAEKALPIIVKSVNSYDALVEVAKMAAYLRDCPAYNQDLGLQALIETAEAALKKALV